LTVAASRIIGRASTGNIAALTAAQVNTILSTATKALDNLASVAINTSLISDTDNTDDLGSSSKEWKDLYIDGTANIDSLAADAATVGALTATANLDIGAYTFRCAGLIDDTLTSGRVIFASTNGLLADDADLTFSTATLSATNVTSTGTVTVAALTATANLDIGAYSFTAQSLVSDTNISMTGELDITGALGCIDLNPAFQTTKNIIDLTPTATINATQIWCGFYINGAALDPGGVDAEIMGNSVDFSGVSEANSPIIHGTKLTVPFGQDALHVEEGQIHIDTILPSTAAAEFTNIDIVIDSSALVSTSEYHAIDVSTTGTPAGTVAAVGAYFGVDPVRQYIPTFATPSQTEFAGVKHTGGTVWADGIDAYGVIFAAVSDAIYVGSATQFDEIEVIMTTGGTKSIQPTFWYNTAADTWTQFFPVDDTDGFQQSGEIRWALGSISATWTADGDPGGADTTAGYWIKIVRTRVGTVGSPDPTTIKLGLATEYNWDKTGALSVLSIAVPTITTVTTLTAAGNLDIGAYTFRCNGLIDDSLTSGRVIFATTNGQLADDADMTLLLLL